MLLSPQVLAVSDSFLPECSQHAEAVLMVKLVLLPAAEKIRTAAELKDVLASVGVDVSSVDAVASWPARSIMQAVEQLYDGVAHVRDAFLAAVERLDVPPFSAVAYVALTSVDISWPVSLLARVHTECVVSVALFHRHS
jgi:hypothetical protein